MIDEKRTHPLIVKIEDILFILHHDVSLKKLEEMIKLLVE